MAIYRGPGGAGDATNDATSQSIIATQAAIQAEASKNAAALSASQAATSASNAATSATDAANSATSASGFADDASDSADAAAAALDEFTDLYLGAKTTNPVVDNDGNALQTGALYFNTVANEFRVYTGTEWQVITVGAVGDSIITQQFSGDGSTTAFTLSTEPFSENVTLVYINGAYQQKNTYSVSGLTLTFSEAPPLGIDNIEILIVTMVDIATINAGIINIADAGGYYTSSKVEGALQEAATFTQSGTGAVLRTKNSKLKETVSVKDFGAVGDGVTDDTQAFTNAVLTGNPVYVPYTADFYAVTALTDDEIKALYGPGTVKIAGTLQQISSSANPLTNDSAGLSYVNANFEPSKWSSVDGSLRNGAFSATVTRTGGFGSYGLSLTEYLVTDEVPSGQFDVGSTAWVSSTDLNGGQTFGAWFGANTPNSELSQTYVSGAAIGMEINVGNRWGDFGLQADIGATRYTVGLQIVPDVLPSQDGAYTSAFPGSFGVVIGQSVHNHKWWVATLLRTDAVMPNGIAHVQNGGSTALLAPNTWSKVANYWNYGIDFGSGTFATAPINIPNSSTSSTATAGGVGTLPAGVQGYLKIAVGGVVCKVPYYNN